MVSVGIAERRNSLLGALEFHPYELRKVNKLAETPIPQPPMISASSKELPECHCIRFVEPMTTLSTRNTRKISVKSRARGGLGYGADDPTQPRAIANGEN